MINEFTAIIFRLTFQTDAFTTGTRVASKTLKIS